MPVLSGKRISTGTARPRPSVLYITHRVPFPPDKGDRIRNYHVLKQLAHVADVLLIALADEPVPSGVLEELQRHASRIAILPHPRVRRWLGMGMSLAKGEPLSLGAFNNREVSRVLEQWQAEAACDAVLVSSSALANYLQHPRLQGIPKFVDLVDVDSVKWADFARSTRGLKSRVYRREAHRLQQLETDLGKQCQAITLVSQAEADVYQGFAGAGTATVATNGVDLDFFSALPDIIPQEKVCAFVGAMDYLPNIDAVQWLAREVWPTLSAEDPAREFWIIGRKPGREVQALTNLPGVKVFASVPDVRTYLARAHVVVVPMRLGRGLQNKVLEALAMCKPTIASPVATAALQVSTGRELLIAQSPDEWMQALRTLWNNSCLSQELGKAGRAYVEDHHHWQSCLAPLMERIVSACPR